MLGLCSCSGSGSGIRLVSGETSLITKGFLKIDKLTSHSEAHWLVSFKNSWCFFHPYTTKHSWSSMEFMLPLAVFFSMLHRGFSVLLKAFACKTSICGALLLFWHWVCKAAVHMGPPVTVCDDPRGSLACRRAEAVISWSLSLSEPFKQTVGSPLPALTMW